MSGDLSLRAPGTWSNGRVLKSEERERKREKDRVAKRKATVRQKESEIRIQTLEQLVAELSGRIVSLEIEIESTRHGRTSNLDRAQINPLIEPFCPTPWIQVNSSDGVFHPLSEGDNPSFDLQGIGIPEQYSYVDEANPFTHSYAEAPISSTLLADITTDSGSLIVQSPRRNSLSPQTLSPLSWEQTCKFEAIISMLYNLRGTNLVDRNDNTNEDLLLRGIVAGWGSVLQTPYGKTCPLWRILYLIDKELYCNSSIITRLAHLRKIYRMFMFIIYGTHVPPWLDPNLRYCRLKCLLLFQTEINRSQRWYSEDSISLKDFIPQPQLRDRLKRTHFTNEFWTWFSHCIIFETSLEYSKTYYISRGSYFFSESFTNDFLRLENWKYSDALIMQFPAVFSCSPFGKGTQIFSGSYKKYVNSSNVVKRTTDQEDFQSESILNIAGSDIPAITTNLQDTEYQMLMLH